MNPNFVHRVNQFFTIFCKENVQNARKEQSDGDPCPEGLVVGVLHYLFRISQVIDYHCAAKGSGCDQMRHSANRFNLHFNF